MRKANGKTRENETLLYERLSRDDNFEGNSYSIQKPEKAADQGRRGKGIWRPRPLFDDGISGATMGRPGCKGMMAQLELVALAYLICKRLKPALAEHLRLNIAPDFVEAEGLYEVGVIDVELARMREKRRYRSK